MKAYLFFTAVSLLNLSLPNAALATPDRGESALHPLPTSIRIAQLDWQTTISKIGAFSIEMPGEPEEVTTTETDAEGNEFSTTEFRLENDLGYYGIGYFDLPAETREFEAQAVLDYIRSGILEDSGLEGEDLVAFAQLERSISQGDHPGREFRMADGDAHLGLQFFLVDVRVYWLFSVAWQEEDRDRFLDSFNTL